MSKRAGARAPYLFCVMMFLGCSHARPSAKDLQRDLAESVPLQSTPGQVLDYLTAHKIEHSQYVRDATQGNLIHAEIRDQSKWDIVKTDCGILFRFDDHDRLLSYEVSEHYTGP
jgi:hypothetical protein